MQERTYRIGEAAKLLNLKTYVLRFWETEFPQLNPHRTEKGQRLYSEQDVAMLRTIRHLLHERGLTIEGARKILAEQKDSMLPLGEGETLPPEAVVPEISQPLYSEALTEAVLSALQRTGQSGYLASHEEEEEVAPDTQSIEAIVARVIASGEGVPPDTDGDASPESMPRGLVTKPVAPAPQSDAQGSLLQYAAGANADAGKAGRAEDTGKAVEPAVQTALVQEVIDELEFLREMLSPRRFR